MARALKTVEDSRTEHIEIVMSAHINGSGYLFGGQLMAWIDLVAGVVARRHAGCEVVTASVDNLQFVASAFVGELILLSGMITYVGNTSMEVRVDTFVESLDGTRRRINRAYLTMVTLKKNEKPIQVPELVLQTDSERAEWAAGEKRRVLRLAGRI